MAGNQDLSGPGVAARVLLVEDNAHDAMLIAEMLRVTWPEGLVLAHASRLADATQELLDHGASCVLLGLPLHAEFDPVEYVHTAAPDVAIVVLSATSDETEAIGSLRAGAQDHLHKSDLNSSILRRSVLAAIERKRSETQLAHRALHDELTGLPNRALFLDRLGVALDRSRRTSASVAVLFLDVDNFKEVNDSLGHAAGDRVLAALAERLRAMLRPMDTVARFGGDEFTFLFEELASEREVVLIAERISRTTSVPIQHDHGQVTVTVSIGIAMVGDPNIPPETVIREADAAMYRAKELGRARYELFDEASRARAMDRLELESALRLAVERSELRVHYQPKVSLDATPVVTGFEALVRWQHPERGLLAPDQFLPLAEETGLVLPIGEFVLDQALRQLARWRASNPALTMSINVSSRQLEDAGLVSTLAAALRGQGTDPHTVCLEVNETAITEHPELAARVFDGLKGVGVRLAIDDYGTGLGSLANLKLLPFDALNIDQSLIGDLSHDPDQAPVIGAIVELAHALGLSVLAEGVETEAQADHLRRLGCDGAQGFLFGRPVPEDEAGKLIDGVLN
ncbi:MAG TPA: EAL domain-containing protein [Solirubrobacteraceae bacterium]|nr:EAL domain-containing protein [Solirubrobacteraceae bacterium]